MWTWDVLDFAEYVACQVCLSPPLLSNSFPHSTRGLLMNTVTISLDDLQQVAGKGCPWVTEFWIRSQINSSPWAKWKIKYLFSPLPLQLLSRAGTDSKADMSTVKLQCIFCILYFLLEYNSPSECHDTTEEYNTSDFWDSTYGWGITKTTNPIFCTVSHALF